MQCENGHANQDGPPLVAQPSEPIEGQSTSAGVQGHEWNACRPDERVKEFELEQNSLLLSSFDSCMGPRGSLAGIYRVLSQTKYREA